MWTPQSLKLCQILRLEHDVPAVDLAIRSKPLAHRLDVVADAGGAPHVVDGVLVAGIVNCQPLGDVGPDIAEIPKFAFIEFLENACLDLSFQEIGGRHHHIVTGFAGEQFCLKCLVGVEGVVLDLDAGFLGEVLENFGVDVIGPVVDIYDALILSECHTKVVHAKAESHGGNRKSTAHGRPQLAMLKFWSEARPPSRP